MQPYLSWDLHQVSYELYLDKPDFPLRHLKQIHSDIILNYSQTSSELEGDGIIANITELTQMPMGIKTADCLPLILVGSQQVAVLHLGWRGLQKKLLAQPSLKIPWEKAFIGPAIGVCCFEVTSEFYQNFPESQKHFESRHQKLYFDLKRECQKQIQENFDKIKIIDSAICTCCRKDLWSYRRDRTTKRIWNIIRQKETYGKTIINS